MKNRKKFYLALVIFSLVGQVAWVVENMYLNVFIYEMFNASAEAISLMVGASAVAATVTTLLMGALSDKLGRRKIFMCAGYLLWGISILGFALVRTDVFRSLAVCIGLTIGLDCLMTFFGSTANDAAFNAWLTDATDETNRGKAEGINAMMPLLAILVVFGGFMGVDQSTQAGWNVIFGVIGGAVAVLGIAGFFLIEETGVKRQENAHYFSNIFYGFRPGVIRENRRLYLALVLFALFNIAIQIFMPYLILYYSVSLKLESYVLIMAPAIALAAVFTALYGPVFDQKGFRTAVLPVMGLLMAGFVVLFLFQNTALVFVGSLLMMCGYLGGMAVFGALIRDCTPAGKAGMFQGLRICFQVLIPGIVGPAIGAAVLKNAELIANSDGTYSFVPNEKIFLAALIAAVVTLAGLVCTFRLMKKGT